mgnify:CR=1 FL=1
MPRKGHVPVRQVLPDPIYNSKLVTRLINSVMLDGKKGVAQQIIYGAFERVAQTTGRDAIEVYEQALENIMPQVEVRSRRVGGATYQVPTEVRPARREALAIRWIIDAARKRGEKTMAQRLSGEFLDILAGNGASLKKKSDVHKMAEANKAFSHFRW